MKRNQFSRLLAFLERLDEAKISYTLHHSRSDALMILVYAPSEYWEIEFLEDGDTDIERYRSNGHIDDESVLEQLFALWAEDEAPVPEAVSKDDGTAGK